MDDIENKIFCWGSGTGGTLGINCRIKTKPHILPFKAKDFVPIFVSAGYHRSTVLSRDGGECYSWGGAKKVGERKFDKVQISEVLDIKYGEQIAKGANGEWHTNIAACQNDVRNMKHYRQQLKIYCSFA